MLLEADNVINIYNYPNLLTAICKHEVSRPYFSKSPQGVREKFGLGTRLGDWQLDVSIPRKQPSFP